MSSAVSVMTREILPILRDPEIRALAEQGQIPKGNRGDSIFRVMHGCAEIGCTNHEILTVAAELCDRWEKYPSTNVYLQWTQLLSMLRRVRAKYPNPEFSCTIRDAMVT